MKTMLLGAALACVYPLLAATVGPDWCVVYPESRSEDVNRVLRIAAEPQLFSEVRFSDPPPSWTEMATNLNPQLDSFAVAVWSALKEYDWTDLIPKTALDRGGRKW